MPKSEHDVHLFQTKEAEAQAAAARLAKVTQIHAELLAAAEKELDDPSQWPAVWAGAITSGFGKYAFTNQFTGGTPHPWWTAAANATGSDWTAWATGTWAGAGQFYKDPAHYFGKQVWLNLTCGGLGAGGISLYVYESNGGLEIGKFGAYFSGIGGCNISCPATLTSGP